MCCVFVCVYVNKGGVEAALVDQRMRNLIFINSCALFFRIASCVFVCFLFFFEKNQVPQVRGHSCVQHLEGHARSHSTSQATARPRGSGIGTNISLKQKSCLLQSAFWNWEVRAQNFLVFLAQNFEFFKQPESTA